MPVAKKLRKTKATPAKNDSVDLESGDSSTNEVDESGGGDVPADVDAFFLELREGVVNEKWWQDLHNMTKKKPDESDKDHDVIKRIETSRGTIGKWANLYEQTEMA